MKNLSFCRINNRSLHLRHTRQPNNTKLESAAQPLARKADLTCTMAEWIIRCDRPQGKFLQYQISQYCYHAKNYVNLYSKAASRFVAPVGAKNGLAKHPQFRFNHPAFLHNRRRCFPQNFVCGRRRMNAVPKQKSIGTTTNTCTR